MSAHRNKDITVHDAECPRVYRHILLMAVLLLSSVYDVSWADDVLSVQDTDRPRFSTTLHWRLYHHFWRRRQQPLVTAERCRCILMSGSRTCHSTRCWMY